MVLSIEVGYESERNSIANTQSFLRLTSNSRYSSAVADADHGTWYRELFAPSVTVGLLKPADLAGYRNGQVDIRKSMHVPLNLEAVRDAMPAFFDLLREEPDPAVRVVLGHFILVYIHPYMDGNGRVERVSAKISCPSRTSSLAVEKTAGGRALAGGAESFALGTLKQSSICMQQRGKILLPGSTA